MFIHPASQAGQESNSERRAPLRPMPALKIAGFIPFLFLIGAIAGPLWWWYGWRIEPENGQIAVLIRKTGKNLPFNEIVALSPEYKGVQPEVLPEGRFFYNPYVWDWIILPATDVAAGTFGVLTRKFGKDLPAGKILAPDDSYKGIVKDVLGTGKHRINPFAYELKIFDDIKIAPGHVGVVTSLCGDDLFTGGAKPVTNETLGFLVGPSAKGVQAEVLKEGTHRLNPFVFAVSIVNIQSQRFEMSGDDAIRFLTVDGFPISVEGTLEFNLNIEHVARLTHEVGDMDDIRQKLILPSARGFSRIEGSKKSATDFIVGETRQIFQDNLEKYLRNVCRPWGISINSVLIRDIIVPQDIASIIRDRELAAQDAKKFEQQIIEAKSKAELAKQQALAEQNRLTVAAETERIRLTIAAEQVKVEQTIAAQTELDVAKVGFNTAKANAEATLELAEADRKVVDAQNRANADVLKQQVAVYKNERDYIRAKLYEKVAPRIETILTTDANGKLLGLPLGDSTPAIAPVVPAPKKEVTP